MNYLASLAALLKVSASIFMSTRPVCASISSQHSTSNQLQNSMTWDAVSLTWPHGHVSDWKPDAWILLRNAASSIQPVLIWVMTALSAFCSPACSLTVLESGRLSLTKSQHGWPDSHCCFHQVIIDLLAGVLFCISSWTQDSAHWVLAFSSVSFFCCAGCLRDQHL